MSREERNATPPVDYYRPIIADADTGHGGLTAVMKLTKLFIGMTEPPPTPISPCSILCLSILQSVERRECT